MGLPWFPLSAEKYCPETNEDGEERNDGSGSLGETAFRNWSRCRDPCLVVVDGGSVKYIKNIYLIDT